MGSTRLNVNNLGSEPINYFNLLANDKFFELIIKELNDYVDILFKSPGKPFLFNTPVFFNFMSRNHFLLILLALHFPPNHSPTV
ncbi:hypothetical protein J437_LFUL008583 [Ladona fulva]|uniref:Uncharacterized protein n=1 Tax=Ladona fulva TaxID=123851 RepID=A0A8K0K778_LADFU|nr:hypothetical protein J437_LFUL008583 [Ladona fulva]